MLLFSQRRCAPLTAWPVAWLLASAALLSACSASNPTAPAAVSSTPLQPEIATGFKPKPDVVTHKFAVAAANPLATRAGLDVIKAGGSAVDVDVMGSLSGGWRGCQYLRSGSAAMASVFQAGSGGSKVIFPAAKTPVDTVERTRRARYVELAPTVTRSNPSATPTNSTSQTIAYVGLEAGATAQCKLDGAAYAACGSSPYTLSGLAGGTHTVSITQTDSVGNVGPAGTVTDRKSVV